LAAAELKRLESEQLALKILANATSYGIFIELNVDDPDEAESLIQIHASAGSRIAKSAKRENPGDFFGTVKLYQRLCWLTHRGIERSRYRGGRGEVEGFGVT
jgi:hypothetical protein